MPDPIRILAALAFSIMAPVAVLLVVGWVWRPPDDVRTRTGGVLGVGTGIYAGCWWLGVTPHWPPREDQDRLIFVLLPAVIVVEVAASFVARPRWLPWILRLAVAASAAPILLYGSSYISELTGPGTREWTPIQMGLTFGVLATLLAAVWCASWLLAKRSACRSIVVLLSLVCAGASVTVMLSGYASGGQIGLPVAAALLGAAIASYAVVGMPEMSGIVALGVVSLFALVTVGRFFGQLSTLNGVLLLCAPLLGWGAESSFVRRGGPVAHASARLVLATVPVVIALFLAHRQFLTDSTQTAAGSNEASADDYMNFGK